MFKHGDLNHVGDTLQPLSMNNIDIQTFGNATNHLEQSTGYYQDLVDAIDYWNSAVSYPDWMQNQEPIQLRISIENPNQPALNDNPTNLGDSTLANASITSFYDKVERRQLIVVIYLGVTLCLLQETLE